MSDPWISQLEHDLNWRESELASMKAALLEVAKGSVRYKVLLRAAWALLYAHYEGFTKFAWDIYLEALQGNGLARKDVSDELAMLSLLPEFNRLKSSMPAGDIWEFCCKGFAGEMQKPLAFPNRLETKSNLWPDLFCSNSKKIGMQCDQVTTNEVKLKSLVGRRNAIAHGEKLEIKDTAEYFQYEECVVLVIHELAIAIVDSLTKRLYVKTMKAAASPTLTVSTAINP